MSRKQLSEEIEEGINKSYLVILLKTLLITTFILSLIYITIFVYDTYSYEDCIETGECGVVYVVSSCNKVGLEDLSCEVKIINKTKEWTAEHFVICGYQEANAFYEQIKPKIEMDLEKYNLSGKIKYLECERR